jgi:hypothetical protein
MDEAVLRGCLRSGPKYEAVHIAGDRPVGCRVHKQVTTSGSLNHKEAKNCTKCQRRKTMRYSFHIYSVYKKSLDGRFAFRWRQLLRLRRWVCRLNNLPQAQIILSANSATCENWHGTATFKTRTQHVNITHGKDEVKRSLPAWLSTGPRRLICKGRGGKSPWIPTSSLKWIDYPASCPCCRNHVERDRGKHLVDGRW